MPQYQQPRSTFIPGVTPPWADEVIHPTPATLTTFTASFGTTPTLILTSAPTLPPPANNRPFFYLAVTNNAAAGGENLSLTCPPLKVGTNAFAVGAETALIPPGTTAYWGLVGFAPTLPCWGTLGRVLTESIFAASSAGTVSATIVIG